MEVSASGNFSELAHAVDLARRRDGPAAAANLKGSAHSADPLYKAASWGLKMGSVRRHVLHWKNGVGSNVGSEG